MVQKPLTQKPKRFGISLYLSGLALAGLLLDLLFQERALFPFFTHSLLFYMALYVPRMVWALYAFCVGFLLDLISAGPMGSHLLLMYLFVMGAVFLRLNVKNRTFMSLWRAFFLLEGSYAVLVLLLAGLFFSTSFLADIFLKSFLTCCFFPLMLQIILWQER